MAHLLVLDSSVVGAITNPKQTSLHRRGSANETSNHISIELHTIKLLLWWDEIVTERELLDLIARARDEEWEELDLAGLNLEVLPPEIGSLEKLKRLVLGKYDPAQDKFPGSVL